MKHSKDSNHSGSLPIPSRFEGVSFWHTPTTQISSPDNSRLLGEGTLWLGATRIAACSMEGLRLLSESRRKLELDLEKPTVIPQSSLSDDPFSHPYPSLGFKQRTLGVGWQEASKFKVSSSTEAMYKGSRIFFRFFATSLKSTG